MPDNILKRLTAIDPYVATRYAYVQCREKALEEWILGNRRLLRDRPIPMTQSSVMKKRKKQ